MSKNPFRAKREVLMLSQQELADEIGITRQVIANLEIGLFKVPPVRVLRYLCRQDYSDPDFVTANYAAWVTAQRWTHQHLFAKVDLRLADGDIWVALKNQVSPKSNNGFARALVYQPSLLSDFEKYGRGSSGIMRALLDVGLSEDNRGQLANYIAER